MKLIIGKTLIRAFSSSNSVNFLTDYTKHKIDPKISCVQNAFFKQYFMEKNDLIPNIKIENKQRRNIQKEKKIQSEETIKKEIIDLEFSFKIDKNNNNSNLKENPRKENKFSSSKSLDNNSNIKNQSYLQLKKASSSNYLNYIDDMLLTINAIMENKQKSDIKDKQLYNLIIKLREEKRGLVYTIVYKEEMSNNNINKRKLSAERKNV